LSAEAPTGASVHMNARAEGEKSLIVEQVERLVDVKSISIFVSILFKYLKPLQLLLQAELANYFEITLILK
jgi:hypothetical protein